MVDQLGKHFDAGKLGKESFGSAYFPATKKAVAD
jgi:hypothetical protein